MATESIVGFGTTQSRALSTSESLGTPDPVKTPATTAVTQHAPSMVLNGAPTAPLSKFKLQKGDSIVTAQKDPKTGGWIYVSADGGVFTTNAAGAPTGNGFEGSYQGLPAADRQGTRTFGTDALKVDANGNYTLTSTAGQAYNFNPATDKLEGGTGAAPTAAPAATPAAARPGPANPQVPSMTSAETDAYSQITATFQQYGFTPAQQASLESWIKSELIAGDSTTVITNLIPSQPAFQQRFPAIAQRMKTGLPPITVSQYLSLEEGYRNVAQEAGIPQTAYNADTLIANDVSNAEFSDRVTQGFDVINNAPAAMKAEFEKYYAAGITPAALATYFLNPKVGQPLLAQQAQSALIGGAAVQAGVFGTGGLTKTNAQTMAENGITQSQATQGFQQLGTEQQLTAPLVGQHQTTENQTQQVAGQFLGNAQDQQQLQYNATTQENLFKGTGSVGSNQIGQQGIGSVAR